MNKNLVRLLFFLLIFSFNYSQALGQTYISKNDALADLELTQKWVRAVHYNPFFLTDSNNYNSVYNYTYKKIEEKDSIKIEEYTLNLMQFLTVINDAHTSINLVSKALIPGLLNNTFFDYNVRFGDQPDIKIWSGADSNKSILSINGVSYVALYQESLSCFGGNYNFKKHIVESIFFPIFLHLKGIHSPYSVAFNDGSKSVYNSESGIKSILASGGSNVPDYSFSILENNIGYLAYNSCNDAKKFDAFLLETFQEIANKEVSKLVIDIRKNLGGNSSLNDKLLNYITTKPYRQSGSRYWKVSNIFKEKIVKQPYKSMWGKKFIKQYINAESGSILKEDDYSLTQPKSPKYFYSGQKCLLIGPQTFSSANFLADATATYNLMPIIGKPTGENTNDFGEQISLTLPNSNLQLQVSIAYDIGADGDQNRIETVDPTMYSVGDALEYAIHWYNSNP